MHEARATPLPPESLVTYLSPFPPFPNIRQHKTSFKSFIMDPLSLAASIAGVAGFVATVVSTTYSYGSSVIHASKAVKEFLAELQSLRTALQQLETIITTIGTSVPQYAQVSAKVASSVNDCKISLEELQGKLEKRQNAGKLKGAMYRMGWPLAEKDTLSAINVLARYRGQFQFALNIDTWQGFPLINFNCIADYFLGMLLYSLYLLLRNMERSK